jgi:hypothetical protein
VHRHRGSGRVERNRSLGWDRDGGRVGRRDHDWDVDGSAGGRDLDDFRSRRHHDDLGSGGNLDDLRAGNSLVSIVGTSTELDSRTVGDANVVASAGIVLAAHAGAARAVGLAVGASAELDGWTTGDTDVETGAGVVLAVTSGGSGVLGVVTTEERETALVCRVNVLDLLILTMIYGQCPCGSGLTSWGADSTVAGPMARARHRAAEKVKDLGDIFDEVEYTARRSKSKEDIKRVFRRVNEC